MERTAPARKHWLTSSRWLLAPNTINGMPDHDPTCLAAPTLLFRMLDENKEAVEIVDEFVLQTNERGLMLGRDILLGRFAVASAERTNRL